MRAVWQTAMKACTAVIVARHNASQFHFSDEPMTSSSPSAHTAHTIHLVRIWDLPTRLFHWLLAASVVAMVVTAKMGGNAMNWHLILGQVVLALLIFRVLWGLVGGYWSRFARLTPSPSALSRYLRGQSSTQDRAGHNPLGALSVIAMLMVLIAQVASGLMSDDEIAFSGPLTRFVSGDTISTATNFHAHWGQYLIYALVGLHVLAIGWYSLRGERLVPAMVHGDKQLEAPVTPARDSAGSRILAAILAVVASGIAWWVHQQGQSAGF